jgi:hypothetical protein
VTPQRASQRAKERPDREQAFFGGDPPQPIFSTSSDINTWKKEAKTYTFQSCAFVEKLMLH